MVSVEEMGHSKKRKRELSLVKGLGKPNPKHPKKHIYKLQPRNSAKPSKAPKSKLMKSGNITDESVVVRSKKVLNNPKESRMAAKEMAESRKRKRKPNYNLEKELTSLWEKMRSYNVGKEERSKLVSEALRKMNGKFLEIAGSHVSARILQTCVKHCSNAERDSIFEALRPHLLTLSCKKYSVHLVKKLLECATKKQLNWFISSLHGHVASLLRHTVGSSVIDYAFHLSNGTQKQSLLVEMYSAELQLFKDLTVTNSGRLVDIISKLGLQKSSVVQHMTSVIQPLLEKGIVGHSIVHKALVEYFTIVDMTSATDVIQQLIPLLIQESVDLEESQCILAPDLPKRRKMKQKNLKEPLLVRLMRTRDGLKVCIICVKHSSAKERKKIIKGIKGHIRKLSLDQYGSLLLSCILSVVDDTKLVTKIVIRELQTMLKELALDKNGRHLILQLLHPNCPRYFGPEDLACLDLCVPSLSAQANEAETLSIAGPDGHLDIDGKTPITADNNSDTRKKTLQSSVEGKKDPFVRRRELLIESGLAESLFETCIVNVGELLQSNFGKEVIYEVAVGGTGGVLQSLCSRLDDLYKAIAALAALPKTNDSQEEHVLVNFHSSRLIRKLVLDCPIFAAMLWKMALEGKCDSWAEGHSAKVVFAFMESSDSKVRDLSRGEVQPLVDRGILKAPENKLAKKEG